MLPGSAPAPTNALVALIEKEEGERCRIALVSVVPNTGDVVWDEFYGRCFQSGGADFSDSAVRSELETRLTHIQPAEFLLPLKLSHATEKVLKHMTGTSRSATAVRVERINDVLDYNSAFDFLTRFYKSDSDEPIEIDLTADEDPPTPGEASEAAATADNLDVTTGLPGESIGGMN